LELAWFVLQDDPGWTPERIRGLIDSGERHVVHLPQRTKVHILYWTCWVDEQHVFHFRRDIYRRDEPLWEALNRQPGGRGPGPLQLGDTVRR
jgi:murein L,D-transpeptidase YcbB/YkuD